MAALARYVEALHRRYPDGPDQLRRDGLDGRAKVSGMVKALEGPRGMTAARAIQRLPACSTISWASGSPAGSGSRPPASTTATARRSGTSRTASSTGWVLVDTGME